jgi:hypothetical protein
MMFSGTSRHRVGFTQEERRMRMPPDKKFAALMRAYRRRGLSRRDALFVIKLNDSTLFERAMQLTALRDQVHAYKRDSQDDSVQPPKK